MNRILFALCIVAFGVTARSQTNPPPKSGPTDTPDRIFALSNPIKLPDGRTIIPDTNVSTPLRWVGLLAARKGDRLITGTGALVGTRTVLTAAHVLKEMEGLRITFYLGLSGPMAKHPGESKAEVEKTYVWEYYDKSHSMNRQGELDLVSWDVGLIRLSNSLSFPGLRSIEKGFEVGEFSESELAIHSTEGRLHISGYDADLQAIRPSLGVSNYSLVDRVPTGAKTTYDLWLRDENPGLIFRVRGAGAGGASGAPLWCYVKGNTKGRATIVGVYSGIWRGKTSFLQGKLLSKLFLAKVEEFKSIQDSSHPFPIK